jgi:hypothetical protein
MPAESLARFRILQIMTGNLRAQDEQESAISRRVERQPLLAGCPVLAGNSANRDSKNHLYSSHHTGL